MAQPVVEAVAPHRPGAWGVLCACVCAERLVVIGGTRAAGRMEVCIYNDGAWCRPEGGEAHVFAPPLDVLYAQCTPVDDGNAVAVVWVGAAADAAAAGPQSEGRSAGSRHTMTCSVFSLRSMRWRSVAVAAPPRVGYGVCTPDAASNVLCVYGGVHLHAMTVPATWRRGVPPPPPPPEESYTHKGSHVASRAQPHQQQQQRAPPQRIYDDKPWLSTRQPTATPVFEPGYGDAVAAGMTSQTQRPPHPVMLGHQAPDRGGGLDVDDRGYLDAWERRESNYSTATSSRAAHPHANADAFQMNGLGGAAAMRATASTFATASSFASPDMLVFDAATGALWDAVGGRSRTSSTKPVPRAFHGQAAAPQGTIVVHGGRGVGGGILADMWVFDCKLGVWQEFATPVRAWNHGIAATTDWIVIAGGMEGSSSTGADRGTSPRNHEVSNANASEVDDGSTRRGWPFTSGYRAAGSGSSAAATTDTNRQPRGSLNNGARLQLHYWEVGTGRWRTDWTALPQSKALPARARPSVAAAALAVTQAHQRLCDAHVYVVGGALAGGGPTDEYTGTTDVWRVGLPVTNAVSSLPGGAEVGRDQRAQAESRHDIGVGADLDAVGDPLGPEGEAAAKQAFLNTVLSRISHLQREKQRRKGELRAAEMDVANLRAAEQSLKAQRNVLVAERRAGVWEGGRPPPPPPQPPVRRAPEAPPTAPSCATYSTYADSNAHGRRRGDGSGDGAVTDHRMTPRPPSVAAPSSVRDDDGDDGSGGVVLRFDEHPAGRQQQLHLLQQLSPRARAERDVSAASAAAPVGDTRDHRTAPGIGGLADYQSTGAPLPPPPPASYPGPSSAPALPSYPGAGAVLPEPTVEREVDAAQRRAAKHLENLLRGY